MKIYLTMGSMRLTDTMQSIGMFGPEALMQTSGCNKRIITA